MQDEKSIDKRIEELESAMGGADFWNDKDRAQAAVKELNDLKQKKQGAEAIGRGDAIMTILSGAGGDDAEDFSRMLLEMYMKFLGRKKWSYSLIHENKNDRGGYRNITIEINGKGAYGTLKNESGVHRLVRVSPFSSKNLRHTSFSMVEVLPKIPKTVAVDIPDADLKIEFAKAGGPGGQNVNKRETAVRIVHIPTNISVHAAGERSQQQNREKAMEILKAKLFKKAETERKELKESMQISKTTDIEWGNQIRSYVLHPYKMVKDHRTGAETSNVDAVLERGELEPFIEAESHL
jgi:peptide chain release factor 2